jgi:Xaa-Pro aminopeptidase
MDTGAFVKDVARSPRRKSWQRHFSWLAFSVGFLLVQCSPFSTETSEEDFPPRTFDLEETFDSAAFQARRDAFLQKLPVGSMAVLATSPMHLRNGDVHFEFRPASNFYFLTGFTEPGAVAIFNRPSDTQTEFLLFVQERDSLHTLILGPPMRPEEAKQRFGADSAFPISAFNSVLSSRVDTGSQSRIYVHATENPEFPSTLTPFLAHDSLLTDVAPLVHPLRFVKDEHELKGLQHAVDITVLAFKEGMRRLEPGQYEYEMESVMDLVRRINGSPRNSFPSILASGPNSQIIHYTANNRVMKSGDLVMVDYGAEFGLYAADLARTLPVNGVFTSEQAVVYDIVLSTQDSIIRSVKPGANFFDLAKLTATLLIQGLLEQGIIQGNRDEIIASNRYLQYAPTGLGHSIGLDVHDPFLYTVDDKATVHPNVTLALEPGIYLKADDLTVAAPYRGICVRIEDNVRVTADGREVMSADLPRTRKEIEAWMSRN